MKNLILITFLFSTLVVKAQTSKPSKPIDGFLGIKFGSTKAQVIAALKAKGAILNSGQKSDDISFSRVKLGNRKTNVVFVSFVNNKAYEADFIFEPETNPQAIDYYQSLVSDITDVYGEGVDHKDFKEPYKLGDGYETTALLSGNADYFTRWYSDNENFITEDIRLDDDDLVIDLIYTDAKLNEVQDNQQKEKNKSEF